MSLKNHFAVILLLLCGAAPARAQWQIEHSGTTAGLRGVHALNDRVAWASGTEGTVLRTVDGGTHWQACSVPAGATKLDFRGVWAWDQDHAMAMSSGPGSQSRIYSTHDGCHSWRLVFTNPDAAGFWDALQFDGPMFGVILGDPVDGRFALFATYDGGAHWTRLVDPCLQTQGRGQGAFAASNQALAVLPLSGDREGRQIWFGASGGWLYGLKVTPVRLIGQSSGCFCRRILAGSRDAESSSGGIFALAFNDGMEAIAVGGDYTKPHDSAETAAYSSDGTRWLQAVQSPAGYRSTVTWNAGDGSWIAAGPGGTDRSLDGGRTWQPLDSANWNALSLPFAVGPAGRIGRLISWGELRADRRSPAPVRPVRVKE